MACRPGSAGRAAVVAAMLLASAGSEASENVVPGTRPADQSAVEQAPAAEGTGTWYGWQVFLADAASVGTLCLGASVKSWPVVVTGSVGWLAGGPAVRALHGDPGAGWSLGRRLLLPLGGALIGFGVGALADAGGRSHSDCAEGCAALFLGVAGELAGATVAMVYDWVAAQEPAPPVPREGSRTWAPVIVATRQMKGVGVALRF